MQTSTIRQLFLQFFASRNHKIIASSSLVSPSDDPTLMWTNSGMLQFKDVFLGKEKRDYVRAATVQKCLRAGGKHNDLDQVGITSRHHTFFEMLGNFSFGDYSKKEAIQYAWEFIIGSQSSGCLELNPHNIWVTVFAGENDIPADIESEQIWQAVGVPKNRIIRCDKKDNFWQMGNTGPCGPCSEIHYDRGSRYAGDAQPNGIGDRVIEIWNLVFMTYERNSDGHMKLLPQLSIDTGMGLERIASILQNAESNYDIDLFAPILNAIWQKTNIDQKQRDNNSNIIALRVIADHIRAATFMIADGVVPSNDGRGYVLRKIIRRALRFGKKLNISNPFFADLCPSVVLAMGDAYPQLDKNLSNIMETLRREEEQFTITLEIGLRQLSLIDKNTGIISGKEIFKLYDTFGIPIDLIQDWCQENNIKCDIENFYSELDAQKIKARSAVKVHNMQLSGNLKEIINIEPTKFLGYDNLTAKCKIIALFDNNKNKVHTLRGHGFLILNQTPFYATSGGQISDIGILKTKNASIQVNNCTIPAPKKYLHEVNIINDSYIICGEELMAYVDREHRFKIQAHHTATHLLQAALRKVLGTHVTQAGSMVDADKLRLDFNHFSALTQNQLCEVENIINKQTLASIPILIQYMSIEEATSIGAMALFGEKYSDVVRVVSIPEFSIELCGGTHVSNTGSVGLVKITNECAVASGIRRIEAVAGYKALEYFQQSESLINTLIKKFNVPKLNLIDFINKKDIKNQQLEQEVEMLKLKFAKNDKCKEKIEVINNVTLITLLLESINTQSLRNVLDQYKVRYNNSAIIVLASKLNKNKVAILVSVSSNLITKIDAIMLLTLINRYINGKGGGNSEIAQGGGISPEGLSNAFIEIHGLVNNLTKPVLV